MSNPDVEPHPFLHEWNVDHDVILKQKADGTILLVKRYETCPYCTVRRVSKIDTIDWYVISRWYLYVKGEKPAREPKPIWFRRLFFATTTLDLQ